MHPDKLPSILHSLATDADYIDHKVTRTDQPLRRFLAGFLSHYPWWIKSLYGVRAGLVRLLGMRQRHPGVALSLGPDEIPFEPGAQATIFKVLQAQEDAYWICAASDRHLTATLGIVREATLSGTVIHVVTLVHHHHWTGPVYLALIRPFHHLVVESMIAAGKRYGQPQPRGASLGAWLVAIAVLHQLVGLFYYQGALNTDGAYAVMFTCKVYATAVG